MKAIHGLFAAVVLAAIAWATPGDDAKKEKAPRDQPETIVGMYDVDVEAGEERAKGVCRIIRSGDGYVLQYFVGLGQSQAIGIRDADSLATSSKSGDVVITGLYRVNRDRSLTGIWLASGDFKKRTEVLTPRR